jgi:tetratricopeptide (TPR) repeat protein
VNMAHCTVSRYTGPPMPELTIPQAIEHALNLHRAGNLPEAEGIYRQILAVEPDQPDALHWLGAIANQTDHAADGLRLLQRAVSLKPDDALIHMDLGDAYRRLNQPEESIGCYRAAVALRPDFHAIHNDLGVVYRQERRYAEALECFSRALELQPSAPAHTNLGALLVDLGRLDEAVEHCDRSLALRPGDTATVLTKSRAFLLKGDIRLGLALYEQRFANNGVPYPAFAKPLWDGSDPAGKTIAVVAEQGLGDSIQFARYIPLLAARGARVLLFVEPAFERLARSFSDSDSIFVPGQPQPAFDFHVPLLSLAHRFGTTLETIPAQVPYLTVEAPLLDAWRAKLAIDRAQLNVGLVWAGSAVHRNDKRRSLALEAFAPLSRVPGVRFFSLQKGPPAAQTSNPPPDLRLTDLGSDLQDLTETAAVVSQLDLVITVDTSVAHLAGALAKAVWTLIPYEPDWRWMLGRDDSPWYPTMKLFRQSVPGDWPSVLDRVASELAALARTEDR